MKLLFCGDVSGAAGRKAVKKFVPELKQKLNLDGVIINGENAAHGLGITPNTYQDLINAGADVVTMGNHTFDKMDVVKIWQDDNVLVRALNYPEGTAGKGYQVVQIGKKKVAVVQVLGRTFMNSKIELADPFQTIHSFVKEHKKEYDVLIVDFHAETTAEKVVMGYQLDGEAALVVGTHTHIPTNDAHVLPSGTAYISDIGMCGDYTSVIGMTRETAFTHFGLGTGTKRLEPATATSTLCAVLVDIDDKTNLATAIRPIILGDTLENSKDLC